MAKKQKQSTYESNGRIQVRVSDFRNGLRVYDGVQLVRIKSKDYSLLIMEDYFPAIGSIHGTVELVTANDTVQLPPLDGFYLHRNNEFSLLIAEETENDSHTEGE